MARHDRVRVRGGGSKTALSAPRSDVPTIDLASLAGIVEYEPGEYTFTALAGTPLRDVEAQLAQHGQALPFDPPLVGGGATLGGTVAAGLSGSGRHRYGGVRDFVLGVRFVDGLGRLVRGGGKVVKNAAGFDLPKLMVGSLGRLGVAGGGDLQGVSAAGGARDASAGDERRRGGRRARAATGAFAWDLEAIDIALTGGAPATVDVRLAGLAGALPERIARLRDALGGGDELIGDRDAEALERCARVRVGACRERSWSRCP